MPLGDTSHTGSRWLYFKYWRVAFLAEHSGTIICVGLLVGVCLHTLWIGPLWSGGDKLQASIITLAGVAVIGPLLYLLNKSTNWRYEDIPVVVSRLFLHEGMPFDKRWKWTALAMYISDNVRRPLMASKNQVECVLSGILPYVFSSVDRDANEKSAECAFFNLLAAMEYSKGVVAESQISMASESNSYRFAMKYIGGGRLHDSVRPIWEMVLPTMEGIYKLSDGDFKGVANEDVDRFFSTWAEAASSLAPFTEMLPKSLNGHHYAMDGHLDDGFAELLKTLVEWLESPKRKQNLLPVVVRRLLEERGTLKEPTEAFIEWRDNDFDPFYEDDDEDFDEDDDDYDDEDEEEPVDGGGTPP